MWPVLFRWRGLTFWSYPSLLYIGLVAGVFAGNAAARASGLDPFRVWIATFALILPALFGARLLFVAGHWTAFRADRRRIVRRSDGGASQYGGLLLAVPLSFPVLSLLDLPLGAFWDVGVITILVGMIPTRIGCLLNGCCAGRPTTSWCSVYLPNQRGVWARRLPSQYLEALLAAALLGSGLALWHAMPFGGALFLFVLGGYGAGRLILESYRELPPGRTFTVEHAISAAIVVASLAAFSLASR